MKLFKKENEPSKLTVITDDGKEEKISDLEIINAAVLIKNKTHEKSFLTNGKKVLKNSF